MKNILLPIALLFFVLVGYAATKEKNPPETVKDNAFTLHSSSFTSGTEIPKKYTCLGGGISPSLQWEITSDKVKSFALIVEDPDAVELVGYPYVHWNVFHIAGEVREIAEGATGLFMPSGSIEGTNHDHRAKYSGPCPPAFTGVHHYVFTLYALNQAKINIDPKRTFERSQFEKQYAKVIIKKVEITGNYQ